MKCFVCKNKINNELNMILLNQDGDFACNNICKIQYEKDKDEFFQNIHNDKWYENYMNK